MTKNPISNNKQTDADESKQKSANYLKFFSEAERNKRYKIPAFLVEFIPKVK